MGEWVKSSYSISVNCVAWHKSSFSNPSGNSAEHISDGEFECVRDTKQDGMARQPVLRFPRESWKGGKVVKFHATPRQMVPKALLEGRTSIQWYACWDGLGAVLFFDDEERLAWERGVAAGEFPGNVPVSA